MSILNFYIFQIKEALNRNIMLSNEEKDAIKNENAKLNLDLNDKQNRINDLKLEIGEISQQNKVLEERINELEVYQNNCISMEANLSESKSEGRFIYLF